MGFGEGPAAVHPLSYEQEGIWLREQAEVERSRYVESWVHRLRGPLDAAAVQRALTGVVRRHEALRSRLRLVGGRPRQEVLPPMTIPLARRRIAGEELDEAVRGAVSVPVPLEQAPLLRATLLELGPYDAVLAVAVHHAVVDGWSLQLLDEEFSDLYTAAVVGHEPSRPELELQFGAFARQQRDAGIRDECAAYWRRVLKDAPVESTVPFDRPRPSRLSARGGMAEFLLDGDTHARIRQLGRTLKATPYVLLAAATTALLARHSGRRDIVLGTPVSRRGPAELEPVIACLTDVMPVRQDVRPDQTFRQLVLQNKEAVRSVVAHRDMPYAHLVNAAGVPRTGSRFPLCQVVLTVDDGRAPGLSLPGVEAERLYPHDGTAKFDLFLHFVPEKERFRGRLEYAADLFSPQSAERLTQRFRTLLDDALAHPNRAVGELALLSSRDRDLVLRRWPVGPEPVADAPPVHEAFAEAARRYPRRAAVVHGADIWSYRRLDAASAALARVLVAEGCGGSPVGILLDRSLSLPLAVLAVLRAGCCCVPVDPDYPAERIALMLRDSGVRTVLTSRDLQHAVSGIRTVLVDDASRPPVNKASGPTVDEAPTPAIDHPPTTPTPNRPPLPAVRDTDPAYLIYTSGSTGRPKGVLMPHRALAQLVRWQTARTGSSRVTAQFAPLSFDVAFQEMFSTWAACGTLVLCDTAVRRDPARLLALVEEYAVDRLFLPFVALQNLAEYAVVERWRSRSLREVVTAGEQLFVTPAVRRFFAECAHAVLDNQYGPSETHVVTAERLSGDPDGWPDTPPIGRPVAGARVYVLDERLRPVPPGTPGEICIGGTGVALGYHQRPGSTARRFVPDPFAAAPARLYRSGDVGRYLPDGRIEFLGRTDDQVKIRGHRVELGEVEAAVRALPGIADALVTVDGSRPHGNRLVVHYRPAGGPRGAQATRLRRMLGERLPGYLVPAVWLQVAEFPLTPSGKVDRSALPKPDEQAWAQPEPEEPAAAEDPPDEVTRRVAALWCELLGVRHVGAHDDFFALGGDSLLAVRLLVRVHKEWGIRLSLGAMSASPTVARMAALLTGSADLPHEGTADDLRLDPAIMPVQPSARPAGQPRCVFLTGATGFLGAFLLGDLLRRTDAVVHCLVRAEDAPAGRRRLRRALERYGLWDEDLAGRIAAVPGDLAKERLGLSEETFSALARDADAVYHAGASVNLASSYDQLRQVNVRGTVEVLRLAAHHRTVPMHHVSTVGVFGDTADVRTPIRPDAPLPPGESLHNGYARSKWAAEKLLAQARARGLPVTVYRPTRIAGASDSGRGQTGDYLWLLLKGCVEAEAAPEDLTEEFDLVPVDCVSSAVVSLSLARPAQDAHHVASGRGLPFATAIGYLRAHGYRIASVPLARWRRAIEDAPGNSAYPLLSLLPTEAGPGSGDGGAVFDGSRTRDALGALDVAFPDVDEALFTRYVAQFVESGFLPPGGRRRQEDGREPAAPRPSESTGTGVPARCGGRRPE